MRGIRAPKLIKQCLICNRWFDSDFINNKGVCDYE